MALTACAEPILDGEFSRITGDRPRESWWLSVMGRLKGGWDLKRAGAQLAVITLPALQETVPPQYDGDGVKHYLGYKIEALPAANGFSQMRRDSSEPLFLLLGLSGLVLLIACANLANARWWCAWLWALRGGAWFVNCSPKARCWPFPARFSEDSWRLA